MTNSKTTKSALFSSVIALLLCFTMLLGSTFAWFTDSVTSSTNIIQSGTLDVEMYYTDGTKAIPADDSAEWLNASGVAIYTADHLWEPGYTDAKHLKVSNEGSLALKYQLAIVPTGEVSKLADVIDVYYIENGQQISDRTVLDTMTKRGTLAELINTGIATGNLADGEDFVATIVLKMQEDASNEYQNLSIGDDFAIQLLATQYTSESDSFDNQYDADAWMPGMIVYSEADLNAAIANGGNVILGADVELQNYVTVAEGSTVAINLNGHKISAVSGNVIRNNGQLTVVNGVLEGTTTYTINNASANGSVTVENVASVNGGFFNGGTMVVNNCEITNTASGKHALYNGGTTASLVVSGGTYSTTSSNAIVYAYAGTVVIDGGDFTQIGSSYMIDGSGITINGGTFTDDDGKWAIRGSNHTITGGTFNFDPSAYVADGFKAIQIDETYYVVPDTIVEADLYIANAIQLKAFADGVTDENNYAGKTVALINDIDLANVAWTPINNFKGTFNGNGKTISNLTTVANKYAGMFGYLADSDATITNLTIDGANVTANTVDTDGYAGAVLGYHFSSGGKLTISDVKVTNSNITGKNGGAIAGSASMITVSNCVSQKNTIVASRNGGIVGTTLETSTVSGCTVSDNTQNTKFFESESAFYVGTIVGRVSSGTVADGNVIETTNVVEAGTQDALNSAVSNGKNAIVNLADGDYTMPTTSGDVAISGSKDTVITVNDITATNVTFNGVTVKSSGESYTGIKHSDAVVYNDCVIVGNKYLYAEKVVFNNCTFDLTTTNDYIWVYGATNVEFNKCTFNTMGKAILVFQDGSSVDQTVKVEGCTFNASAAAYNWDKTIHIAAVSLDGSQGGTYNIILNNNTVDEDFNGLWQDKTSAGNITVTVDGKTVLTAN